MKWVLSLVLFGLMVSPANAVGATGSARVQDRMEAMEEKKEEIQERVEERKGEIAEKRCEVIENKIRIRVTRYENNRASVERLRERVVAVVGKVIEKAKEEGLETAEVERKLEEFKNMVGEAEDAYTAHIGDLVDTEEYACGESEGVFVLALKDARDSLKLAREEVLEVRSFYQEELKPVMQRLRNQSQVKGLIDVAN